MSIRFAPAASGKLHVGNLRIIFVNYLLCLNLKLKKEMLLRIDFQNGVSEEKENFMISNVMYLIKIFNIDLDIKVSKARDRFIRYYEVMEICVKGKFTYEVDSVIYLDLKKMYNENYIVRFKDLLIGRMYKNINYINNPIIYSQNKKLFFYNFMSVVDDIDFKIEYVVRGNDHIDNTYVQILMFDLIGKLINIVVPKFLHIPMCVTKFGKVSKSSEFDFSVDYFLNQMIFPCVIKKYLIDIDKTYSDISKSQKLINEDELNRINIKYIRKEDSKILHKVILSIWKHNISFDLLSKFKPFVRSPQDFIGINSALKSFLENKIKINNNIKNKILKLKTENMNDVYSVVGKIFGYEYLGKEFIEFIGLEKILK